MSAIITTHNRAPHIVQRAVTSAFHQTYQNIEIIVVDDSTPSFAQRPEVEQIVRDISEDIIYIKQEFSQGACAARNTGLQYSHGFYIAFLDDDDEWYPEKIEEQIQGFADEKTAIVYSGIIIVDEVMKRQYAHQYKRESGQIFESLLKKNIIGTTSNPLIKKHCLEEIGGFDELMESCQDLDLWLRLTIKYPVYYYDCPLTKYHIHVGERISTNIEKKISGMERINLKYHDFFKNDNETWYLRHIILLPYYLKKYGRKRAIKTWIRCVERQPAKLIDNLKYLLMCIIGIDLYTRISGRIHCWMIRNAGDSIE